MSYTLGKNSTENLESLRESGKSVSESLIGAVKCFILESPIDFGVISNGGYRTAEEQNVLYKKGVSSCDGYLNLSEHQKGLAVDLVPWVDNKYTWDENSCFLLAGAFLHYCKTKNLNITSGADWNSDGNLKDGWDPCHMQIKET